MPCAKRSGQGVDLRRADRAVARAAGPCLGVHSRIGVCFLRCGAAKLACVMMAKLFLASCSHDNTDACLPTVQLASRYCLIPRMATSVLDPTQRLGSFDKWIFLYGNINLLRFD